MKKKVLLVSGIVSSVLVLCLLGLFFFNTREYFADQFGRHTYISNTDVSSLTVEEAVMAMNESRGFCVTFTKNGTTQSVDISSTISREFSEEEIVACKGESTFIEYLFGRRKEFQVEPAHSDVDEERLLTILKENLPTATKKTVDAYLNEEFELVPEVYGDEIHYNNLVYDIRLGIQTGKRLDYKLEDYYIKPKFTKESENILTAVKDVEAYTNLLITYQFGEETERIGWNKIKKHLSYNPDTAVLTLKTKWIQSYVRNLGKKYNTYGKTRRFKSTKDGKITIHGGIMGWWIHEDETVKQLKGLLKKKKSKRVEPVYRSIAAQHGKDDIGKTYVEISIDRQHLWFYKNGKLKLESDIVTGRLTKERKTTVGVHRIYGKERDRYLGTMAVQGYRSFVHYWMPFNWDGQGLHDASWRSKFGGSIYKTGGSHGCVNLPSSFAGKLYEAVTIGTPVVVY